MFFISAESSLPFSAMLALAAVYSALEENGVLARSLKRARSYENLEGASESTVHSLVDARSLSIFFVDE